MIEILYDFELVVTWQNLPSDTKVYRKSLGGLISSVALKHKLYFQPLK